MGLPYEALRFANSLRREIGLKPAAKLAPGKTYSDDADAIANTVRLNNKRVQSVVVDPSAVRVTLTSGKTIERKTPQGVQNFLDAFDDGRYPELIRS